MNKILFIFSFLLLVSCSQTNYHPYWAYNGPCPANRIQYEEDKQQFIQSYLRKVQSKQWLKQDYPNISLEDRFFVNVDTILYSKDLRFLFVFYGRGDKGAIGNMNTPLSDRPACYKCESAIGYRNSKDKSLTFYENMLTINWDNYRDGMDGVESYYLTEFKDDRLIPTWEKYGKIGYNVNDSAFFERTRLFQMFNDSLYYFQIEHIIDRSFKNMPDSIILRKHF